MSKTLKHYLVLTALLLTLLGSSDVFAERLTATVDRTIISENETFTLEVKYEDGNNKNSPDFSPLTTNFDILGNSQSSQYVNNNGRISNFTLWTITLAPKQAGKALIPPLNLDKVQSAPILVTVNTAQNTPNSAKLVFIETDISEEEVYVQEEFSVSIKLYFRENIIDVKTDDFAVKGASIEELPRSQYQTTLGQYQYQVIELHFAVTPDSSGQLDIPSYTWNIRTSSAPNNRFGASSGHSTLHRLKTDSYTVQVKPRPDNYPASASWLPAKSLVLSEKWSDNPPKFVVGEPVTRNITVTARGLTGEQLPPITSSLSSTDFKFYPDQPEITSDTDQQGKLGARKESMAIVPTRAGQLTLPAIEITWWDTQSDTVQVATLPAKTVIVLPAAEKPEQSLSAVLPTTELKTQTANAEPTVIEVQDSGFWPWLCGALVLLNFVQLAYLFLHKKPMPNATEPQTLHMNTGLQDAILAAKNNNAKSCHTALAAWVRQQAPVGNTSTRAYFFNLNNAPLLDQIDGLDSHLFKKTDQSWSGSKLAEALQQFNNTKKQASTVKLPNLYPA